PPRAFRHYGCRSSRRAQSSGCPSSRGFREVGIFRSLTSDTVRFLTTHRSKRGQPEISRGSIRHRSGRFRRRALVSQRLNATLRRTGTVFDAPGPGFTSAHGPCFANIRDIDTGFTSAHSPCFANTCYIDTGFSSAHSPCFANTCYIETGFTSARLANNRRPCFANTCFTNDRFTDAWFVNVNDRGFLNAPGPRFTNDRGFSSAHARRQPISRADSSRCNDLRARPISNCPISIGPGGLIQSSAAHARDTTYESGAIFCGHSLLHFRSQYFCRATRCLVGPQPGRSSFHQLDFQRRFAGVLRPNASVDASATANSNAAISRQRKQSCAPDRANNR